MTQTAPGGGRTLLLLLAMLSVSLVVATEPQRFLAALNGAPPEALVALRPLPAPPAVAERPRVVLLLLDGLRRDASEQMPALKALRARGADVALTAVYPSHSRPAYVTLGTGVSPAVTGARNNRYAGATPLDTVLRRAREAGVDVACVADSIGWFAEAMGDGCASSEVTTGARGFVAALRRVLAGDAGLVVLHWIAVDEAGHSFGGGSGEYTAAVRDADLLVGDVVERVVGRPTVLAVVSDHGHSDGGGHGGLEPDVAEIPLVMAGPGVRRGVTSAAASESVAPTLAALAALPLPAAAQAPPIWGALEAAVAEAYRGVAEASLVRAWTVLGREESRPAAFPEARAALAVAGRSATGPGRWLRMAAALALLGVLVWRILRVGPRSWRWILAGLAVPAGTVVLHVSRGDPLSLSSVARASVFVPRLAVYVAAVGMPVVAVALARTLKQPKGQRTLAGLPMALGTALGAVAPWLVAWSYAGPRPFPELPGPAAVFLPVLLTGPACLGLFCGALIVALAVWFDDPPARQTPPPSVERPAAARKTRRSSARRQAPSKKKRA